MALCYNGRVLGLKYILQNAAWEGGVKTHYHYLKQTGSIIQ